MFSVCACACTHTHTHRKRETTEEEFYLTDIPLSSLSLPMAEALRKMKAKIKNISQFFSPRESIVCFLRTKDFARVMTKAVEARSFVT